MLNIEVYTSQCLYLLNDMWDLFLDNWNCRILIMIYYFAKKPILLSWKGTLFLDQLSTFLPLERLTLERQNCEYIFWKIFSYEDLWIFNCGLLIIVISSLFDFERTLCGKNLTFWVLLDGGFDLCPGAVISSDFDMFKLR